MYKWFYRGMTFDSDSSEIYGKGVMKIPKAYNRQGVIWEKSRGPDYEICFWDWTGRLLYAMPRKQFLKLTAFPANIHPDASWPREKYASDLEYQLHQYLTDDGWTYTLEQAKETALKCGFVDIAAVYKTPNDGQDTVYWIEAKEGHFLCDLGRVVSGSIDWGDGTTENNTQSHTYQNPGIYAIHIAPLSTLTIGYFESRVLAQQSWTIRVRVVAYEFGYRTTGTNKNSMINSVGLYTGHATFSVGALFESTLRFYGMVRDFDPFSSGSQDGLFEDNHNLLCLTISPGVSFPTFGGVNPITRYENAGFNVIRDSNTTGQTYVAAYYSTSLKHIFLPYGWTGHKQAVRPYGTVYTDTPFSLYGSLGRVYPSVAISSFDYWNGSPLRLVYPLTTERLLQVSQGIYSSEIAIPLDEFSAIVERHSVSENTKYYVPDGTLDYYAYKLPSGGTLKASGRIIEVT